MAAKNYTAIASQKIRKAGESKRKPRFLVYGRNKKGKTRFCATAPDVLILDPEDGTREETKIDPDIWPIDTWDDIHEVYGFLKSGGKSPKTGRPYQWVALDGMTKIANIALRWVQNQEEERSLDRKPNQVTQNDYGRSGEMVKGILTNFHSLRNVGIILTAQERMIEVTEMDDIGDEDATPASFMFVPDLPKGARSAVNQMVDVIGRIYTVRGEFEKKFKKRGTDEVITKTVEGIQRRLWIAPHDTYDTGYRSSFILPDFIKEPTVSGLMSTMRQGKVEA